MKFVFANSDGRGVLPNTPTFANILKSTSSNQNTFTALSNNQTINGSSYVTYGINNIDSDYVIAAQNTVSVTLKYEGIMNGSNAFSGNVIGETFNEWISFGVESEPVYVFSGTVFNDNGGINDNDARTDTIGGIYDNSRYFNGVFNPTPASSPELGISGSTVRLVDSCSNPTVEYASTTTNSTGNYKFTLLRERLSGVTSVCIIETSNNSTYPIRTTTDKKKRVIDWRYVELLQQ